MVDAPAAAGLRGLYLRRWQRRSIVLRLGPELWSSPSTDPMSDIDVHDDNEEEEAEEEAAADDSKEENPRRFPPIACQYRSHR